MHLQTVLVLIHGLRHPLVEAFSVSVSPVSVELVCRFSVDSEIAEWSGVMRAFAESGSSEVVMMRWSQKKYTFAI
jgi:hypothetical protein